MSYVNPNYKTKKQFKAAVAAGVQHEPYNPSGMWTNNSYSYTEVIEGPHYPQPHRWYARVQVENGIVTRVLS